MADDEQFSLCWNNFNTNLSAGFHESLIRGDLVDVTLAAEGQLVKAHRLILSVCSPYFRKMFTQMPANQHAFIFLKDVSHSALKDLIQFMYCGEVNVKQDALPAFISTAEALQIKGLTETGESAPTQQSPAKETSHHHLPSSGATTIPSSASSPRAKPLQRSRIHSYKLESDDGSDQEKVVQIQATSTPAAASSSSSSGPSATIVATQISAAPQQVQLQLQQQQQAQKRTLQQRTSITPQTSQVMKRAKLSDPLEGSEPTQIQTVQIVKQITQTQQSIASSEPEYVEMPIETINPKAEPEYADDPSEVEAIEAEHDQEQALAEQEAAEHDQDADDSANYVEDETYGDMSKYDESYFTEGDDAKAGASGFGSESYAEGGTAADQAAQAGSSRYNRGKLTPAHKEALKQKNRLISTRTSGDKSLLPITTTRLPILSSTRSVGVDGFTFPLQTADEIECLEAAVRESRYMWDQYVEFLRDKKTEAMDIPSVMKLLFLDEALDGYNFNGIQGRMRQKRPLKMYAIFVDCMLEAWREQEIYQQQLQKGISAALALCKSRERVKRCRENKQRRARMSKEIQEQVEIVVYQGQESIDLAKVTKHY